MLVQKQCVFLWTVVIAPAPAIDPETLPFVQGECRPIGGPHFEETDEGAQRRAFGERQAQKPPCQTLPPCIRMYHDTQQLAFWWITAEEGKGPELPTVFRAKAQPCG